MTINMNKLRSALAKIAEDPFNDRYTDRVTTVLDAAPELYKVAQAVLAWRSARIELAEARDILRNDPVVMAMIPNGCLPVEPIDELSHLRECERNLLEAISEVEP